jgi:molecular chaperone HscB
VDPFDVLGLPPTFSLDLDVLEQRHRDLSRALHPDRHAAAGAAERRLALGHAIEVNAAFRSLKDPIERGRALLARRGVTAEEGKEAPPSPAFLMQVMDRREALAEIRQSKSQVALSRLLLEVEQAEELAIGELSQKLAFESTDFKQILSKLGELRYYRRFREEAAAIADDLF